MVRAGCRVAGPAVSARRLSELDKGERRRAWLHTVAVLAVARVVLVGVYYLVPTGVVPASRWEPTRSCGWGPGSRCSRRSWLGRRAGSSAPNCLGCGRSRSWVLSSPVPGRLRGRGHVHRAARPHPGAVLHHHVFSTVGFGDLTPRADLARIIVSIQMLLDLVILGSVVRLLLNAAQIGLTRARDHSDQP